jgi:hypothetical protein
VGTWYRILSSIGAMIAAAGLVAAQPSIDNLNVQRGNVVLIHVTHDNGSIEDAAALYVGKDQTSAYFATALHAVKKHENSLAVVESVKLQFYTGGNQFAASVFRNHNEDQDLAVIMLPVAELPSTMAQMSQRDPGPEMAIHIIGHPPSNSWSSWTGRVTNETSVNNNANFFATGADPTLTNGFSGGPVLSSSGDLIGLHLANLNTFSRNLRSSVLLASLRAWQVPTDAFVAVVGPDIRKLVLEFDNRLATVEGYEQHVVDPNSTAADRQSLGILIWRVWYGDHEYHATQQEFNGVRWVDIVTRLEFAGVTRGAYNAEQAIHDIERAQASDPQYGTLLSQRVATLHNYSQVLHQYLGD